MTRFAWHRFWAMVLKEFVQMRRDRVTFAMMIGIPVMQLLLFGYAINSDPRHLNAVILNADQGPFGRSMVAALENSDYFNFDQKVSTEAEARRLIEQGEVQFVVNIPVDFSRRLLRGERPPLLIEADATDPAATGGALAAVNGAIAAGLRHDLKGPLAHLAAKPGPVEVVVHRHYNPEVITQYNIVPGLMGVVLTMTMVIITALAITRERERGTMENLLSTPARPLEVMTGKIVPYVVVGYIQLSLILIAARFLFEVPLAGSVGLLYATAFLFIVANLSVGITFSTIAKNQLQAMQMAFFFFLPSILLSGFMFPFAGMPEWAQRMGSVLPLTHFLRVVRGIMLKGNGLIEVLPHLWPMALFALAMLTIGVRRYRQTLD